MRSFPSQRYAEALLEDDPSVAYSGISGLMADVLNVSAELYPMSPFRIIRLIERASGNEGQDSLTATPHQLYGTVSSRAREIAERCGTELEPYTKRYRQYLQRQDMVKFGISTARFLMSIAILALMIGAGWIIYVRYGTSGPHLKPVPFRALILIIFAVSVGILLPGVNLIFRRLLRANEDSLRSTKSVADRRILHELEIVALELVRASTERRFDPLLRATEAPTLIELDSPRVLPSDSFDEVIAFLKNHVTSAVGIAGRRGTGKTTLLRWLIYSLEPEWVGIYISAPAVYDVGDFVRVIFDTTVRAILKDQERVWRGPLTRLLDRFRLPGPSERIMRMSQEALRSIAGSRSSQQTTKSGLSGKGIAFERGRQLSWTERERSHAEWVAAYTQYLDNYSRFGGRPLAIAIDELDKLAATEDAISMVNGLKDLFHLPNTHFVVSVSEDALHRFAMRGIPFRDAFDSTFDTIVKVQPPSPDDACKMLDRRVGGFPVSVGLFCYAWSGGLPRDLIRIARSCVEFRRRQGRPVSVAELAPRLVKRDVADAIDAAITRNLESGRADDIELLLAARHSIEDEGVSLTNAMRGLETGDAAQRGDIIQKEAIEATWSVQVYLGIASVISQYFSSEVALAVGKDLDKVFSISAQLAQAKAALATHPAEAEWMLTRACAAIDRAASG